MDVIRHQGYLIVGVDQNTKLLGYYNPNTKQFEGFDIDIAHEIAKAIFGADLTRQNSLPCAFDDPTYPLLSKPRT